MLKILGYLLCVIFLVFHSSCQKTGSVSIWAYNLYVGGTYYHVILDGDSSNVGTLTPISDYPADCSSINAANFKNITYGVHTYKVYGPTTWTGRFNLESYCLIIDTQP